MTWSYWLCDTITGAKLLEVEPAAGSWGKRLNTIEGGSHTFSVGDGLIERDDLRDYTSEWARTLVQCWDDTPVYAGLITGRPYDVDTQMLTLNHADVRSIFLARWPFGVNSYWEDEGAGIPGKLTITSKTLVAAAAKVLEQGMIGPVGAADYTLPITLPSTSTSGTYSTVYENFNFQRVHDILTELEEMDGGPDIEFVPQWSAGDTLEWAARIGTLTGGTFVFDLTDPDSPVSSVQVQDDALKQVTGVFGVGEGYGDGLIVGGTPGVPVAEIPARDDLVTWRNVKTNAIASSLAKERVAAYQTPTVEPSLTVMASEVDPTSLVLGSTISLTFAGDPFIPDGTTDYRLVGISGGVGLKIKLYVQGVRS